MFGSRKKSSLGAGAFGSQSTIVDVNLNLTPLLDVMSNILFFLLAAFGASMVAILPATTPVQSSEGTDVEKQTDAVTAMVRVTLQGINLSCQNDALPPAELKACETYLAKDGANYDHAGLTGALRRIKEKYPASHTMVLAPDDSVRYQEVVRFMDAARQYIPPEILAPRMLLFPDVVLSGVVTAEPGGAPERK